MTTRYGDRDFDRDEESLGERDDSRRDNEPFTGRTYGTERSRYGRTSGYGASPRYGADHDYNEYTSGYTRPYGDYAERGYGSRDYGQRYGREGRYAGGYDTTDRGYDYGERRRDYDRDYGVSRTARERARDEEGERIRSFDTDYGRTTSRFYGRSGLEYGRDDYDDRFDGRDERRGRDFRGRGRDDRGWWDRAADEVMSWFGDEEAVRRRRMDGPGEGRYRGRGPKNYRRSDERIRDDINDRLTDNDWLDASDVEVAVTSGEVALTGTVDSRYAKRIAEDIAESVTGVVNVQNNLRVHNQRAQIDAPRLSEPTMTSGSTLTNDVTESGKASKAAGRS